MKTLKKMLSVSLMILLLINACTMFAFAAESAAVSESSGGSTVKAAAAGVAADSKGYIDVLNTLFAKYGALRIVKNTGGWENEANGLCYLNLIDFTGDGEDELLAIGKNEGEKHYTGYIYTIKKDAAKKETSQKKAAKEGTSEKGTAVLLYENPKIEYNANYDFDIVYLGHTTDTGYVFGTGRDAPDIEDRTFFWYKNGSFEPVYRSKGHYDNALEEEVVEEELKTVDLFDDLHEKELWNSFPRVLLRTMGATNESGEPFDPNTLQSAIDDVIRKLDAAPGEVPQELTHPGGM